MRTRRSGPCGTDLARGSRQVESRPRSADSPGGRPAKCDSIAVRSRLHEFFSTDSQAAAVLATKLTDADPPVVLAATGSFFDASPVPLESIVRVARSTDTYLRQCATRVLAERAPFDFLKTMFAGPDDKTRLAGVLAAGFRLTLPLPTKPIDPSLPLAAWPEEAAYRVQYLDATIDFAQARPHRHVHRRRALEGVKTLRRQEALFSLLREHLDDSAESVRLEAAYFLSLLNDPRANRRSPGCTRGPNGPTSPMHRCSRSAARGPSDRLMTDRAAYRASIPPRPALPI